MFSNNTIYTSFKLNATLTNAAFTSFGLSKEDDDDDIDETDSNRLSFLNELEHWSNIKLKVQLYSPRDALKIVNVMFYERSTYLECIYLDFFSSESDIEVLLTVKGFWKMHVEL